MGFADNKQKLIAVLRDTREFLARPDNDFCWSSWKDAASALQELDGLIEKLESGELPDRSALEVLFVPTGPLGEVSLSSGWGDDYVKLGERFDRAMEKLYGIHPQIIARHRAEMLGRMREGVDGRLRWLFLFFFAVSIGYTTYLHVAHETPEIYYPIRLSGNSAWRLLVFAAIFFGVLTIVNWISWFSRKKVR